MGSLYNHNTLKFYVTIRSSSSSSTSSSSSSESSSSCSWSISSSSSSSSTSVSSSSVSSSSSSESSTIDEIGGVYKLNDDPVGNTVLGSAPLLIDGDLVTPATSGAFIEGAGVGAEYSLGLATMNIPGIDVWCAVSGTDVLQENFTNPRTAGRFKFYQSDDNLSWSVRSLMYSGTSNIPGGGTWDRITLLNNQPGTFGFRIQFQYEDNDLLDYLYWKLHAEIPIATSGASGSSGILIPTEVRYMGKLHPNNDREEGWHVPIDNLDFISLSNNNRTIYADGGGRQAYSRWYVDHGKYYWEISLDGTDFRNTTIGFFTQLTNAYAGQATYTHGMYYNVSNNFYLRNDGAYTPDASAYNGVLNQGDIIGIAVDQYEGKWWLSINNTWILDGDPASGSNPIYSSVGQGNIICGAVMGYAGQQMTSYFRTSQFNYTPPTGFISPIED